MKGEVVSSILTGSTIVHPDSSVRPVPAWPLVMAARIGSEIAFERLDATPDRGLTEAERPADLRPQTNFSHSGARERRP